MNNTMAKKSARSKGYRTYKKVDKGFTKQELRTMIIGFAVIVIVILGIIFVPDWIESRHLLKVKGGVVQDMGDNWLIRDVSSTSKAKYRKIAEIEAAEGYQLATTEDGISDANEKYYTFEPVEEGAAESYYSMAGAGKYTELASTAKGYAAMFAQEVTYESEILETEVDGKNVAYFLIEYTLETSGDEENPVYEYAQDAYAYVESPIDGNCVVICASNSGDSDEVYGDRDAMLDLVLSASKGVTMSE